MPVALITPEAMRDVPAPYVDILREGGFEVRYPRNPLFARGACEDAETIEELKDVHATIASTESYSEAILGQLPHLRVIARAGVGYDRVDVPAATARRVAVTITPTSNHESVAELALALLFGVTKSLVRNDRWLREGQWVRELLMPIRGNTFGILGLGRIGRSTAVRAKALGTKVIACEQFPDEKFVKEQGIELVDFPTLLARSDFLSVHCPLNDETKWLFSSAVFAQMKPGAIFINTARGGLVREADLIEALQSGHLRGAGLDVFEQEPPDPQNPLFQMDNVVVSPHLAGCDSKSLMDMGIEAAECIVKLHRGEWPDGAVVNDSLRDDWRW